MADSSKRGMSTVDSGFNPRSANIGDAIDRKAEKEIERYREQQRAVLEGAMKIAKIKGDIADMDKAAATLQKRIVELTLRGKDATDEEKRTLSELTAIQKAYVEQERIAEREKSKVVARLKEQIEFANQQIQAEIQVRSIARQTAEEKSKTFMQERKRLEAEAEKQALMERNLAMQIGMEKEAAAAGAKSVQLGVEAAKAREKELKALQSASRLKLAGMSTAERQDYMINASQTFDADIESKNLELSVLNEEIASLEAEFGERNNQLLAQITMDRIELDRVMQDEKLNDAEKQDRINELSAKIEETQSEVDTIGIESAKERRKEVTEESDLIKEEFKALGGKIGEDGKSKLDISSMFGGAAGGGVKEALGSVLGAGKKGFLNSLSAGAADGMIGGFLSGAGGVISKGFGAVLNKMPTWVGVIVKILKGIANGLAKIGEKMNEGIEQNINLRTEYLGPINARLQGLTSDFTGAWEQASGDYFDVIIDSIDTMGGSAFIDKSKLLQNISALTNEGVAFNLEERALISALGDKLVTTFEANNKELLRLIRLQQQDLTAAQLGAEASLTQFFNENFSDTSYLSQEYDNVMSNISEAMALMTSDDAVNFNYNVQKWLGSMYSMGASSDAISKLAQGINALATGDVDYFNGNSAATVLFAGSSGGAFGDLLNNGVNSETINDLMKNIIEYLSQIADDTTMVTKQKRAGVYGDLNLSDIRAILSIKDSVDTIAERSIGGVTGAEGSASEQFSYLGRGSRVSQAEIIDNIFSNLKFDVGNDITTDMSTDDGGYELNGNIMNPYTIYKTIKTFGTDNVIGKVASKAWNVILGTKAIGKFLTNDTEWQYAGDEDEGTLSKIWQRVTGRATKITNHTSYLNQLSTALQGESYNYDFGTTAANRITNRGTTTAMYGAPVNTQISGGFTGITSSSIVGLTNSNMSNIYNGGASSMIYGGDNNSVGVTTIGNHAAKAFSTFNDNINEYGETVSTSTVSNSSVIEAKEADDIYCKLFEDQSTPIRVKLASLEAEAIENLDIATIKAIFNKLSTGVEINDSNSDVSRNVVSALSNIRYIER